MTVIEDLYEINQKIVSTSLEYFVRKQQLKKKEAELKKKG